MDQPLPVPTCCGQEAKWLTPMPNMAYYYCSKCKKEVEATKRQGIFIDEEYTATSGIALQRRVNNSVGGGGFGSSGQTPLGAQQPGKLPIPNPSLGGQPYRTQVYHLNQTLAPTDAIEEAQDCVLTASGFLSDTIKVSVWFFIELERHLVQTSIRHSPLHDQVFLPTKMGSIEVRVDYALLAYEALLVIR